MSHAPPPSPPAPSPPAPISPRSRVAALFADLDAKWQADRVAYRAADQLARAAFAAERARQEQAQAEDDARWKARTRAILIQAGRDPDAIQKKVERINKWGVEKERERTQRISNRELAKMRREMEEMVYGHKKKRAKKYRVCGPTGELRKRGRE